MVRQAAEVTLCISERLPNYLAAAQDVIMPCEEGKVKWWWQQSDNLPHWPSAVMTILLVQPSHALVDYLQACVMFQYKNR